MKATFYTLRGMLLGILIGALIPLGVGAMADDQEGSPSESLPLDQLRVFAAIFSIIKSEYVEEVDDNELLDHAIRGMLAGLDPHSAYLAKREYQQLREGTSGEFGGLGIEVGMEDGFVKVIAPIDDTPAQRAGVEAGDLIVRLDDRSVKGMTLNEAVEIMRGKPGTEIVLTIMREGVDKPLTISIVREMIKVVSVRGEVLEEGYLYLRISHFQMHTMEDMHRLIERLHGEVEGEVRGMVLDLRNNPGGVLSAAIAVSDAFLNGGLVVYTQGRDEATRQDFRAGPDDLLTGAPLVVLVNEGSASASEIVAGALQDRRRALIMGQATFGKGSVQTVVPVAAGDAGIKLTTALYYTPSGRSIQAEGIQPDIVLDRVRLTASEEGRSRAIKERDLRGHLGNQRGSEENPPETQDKEEEQKPPLVERDYELYEALNLLKGLYILGRR